MKTKMDLENSSTNYEYAEDELIDYYLYQIKANQAKLNYLLRKAKKSGIILDRIKELELRKMKYIEDTDVVQSKKYEYLFKFRHKIKKRTR